MSEAQRRGRVRTFVPILVVAILGAATIAVVATRAGDGPTQRVATDDPITSAPADADDGPPLDAAGAEAVLRSVFDRTVDPATAAASIDADDAAQLLAAMRAAAETGGVSAATPTQVEVVASSGDAAAVDAALDTSGVGMASSGVHLRAVTMRRVGGRWLLTREAACGLASGGGMLATPAICTGPAVVRRVAGPVAPDRAILELPGEQLTPRWSRSVPASGSELHGSPDGSIVAVEYPEMEIGGGGPVGPADLVRLDAESGRETARTTLTGWYARVAVDDGDLVALSTVFLEDALVEVYDLARLDPSTFRVVDTQRLGPPDTWPPAVTALFPDDGGGSTSPDGEGGRWTFTDLLGGNGQDGPRLQVRAVQRVAATHTDAAGRVTATVMASGSSSASGGVRLTAVGTRLALWSGETVSLLEP